MDKTFDGTFSLCLSSLQVQLQSLFDEAGGKDAVRLLDNLSNLPPNQREAVLSCFNRVVERLSTQQESSTLHENVAVNDLEESLYSDISVNLKQSLEPRRLEVLSGGKDRKFSLVDKTPISIEEARKAKRTGLKPILN